MAEDKKNIRKIINKKKVCLILTTIFIAIVLFLIFSIKEKDTDLNQKLNKEKKSMTFKSSEKITKNISDKEKDPERKIQAKRNEEGNVLSKLEKKEKKTDLKKNQVLINLSGLKSNETIKHEKKNIYKPRNKKEEKLDKKERNHVNKKSKLSNFQRNDLGKNKELEGDKNKANKELADNLKTRSKKKDKSGKKVWVVDEKAVKEEAGYMWVVDQKSEPAKYKKVWVIDRKARPAWVEKGDKIYDRREYYQAENDKGKKSEKFPYSREGAIKASKWLEENGGGRYWNDIELIFVGYEKIFHPEVKEKGHWEKKLVKEARKEKGHWEKVVFVKKKAEKGHWEDR